MSFSKDCILLLDKIEKSLADYKDVIEECKKGKIESCNRLGSMLTFSKDAYTNFHLECIHKAKLKREKK